MYGLTMSLKNEIVKIAPKGRVNCIGPGWVRTVCLFTHQQLLTFLDSETNYQPMATESLNDPDVVYSALAT